MKIKQPIQVLKDCVLIPLEYLPNADEFEIEKIDEYVAVRPKTNGEQEVPFAAETDLSPELKAELDTMARLRFASLR